jgi:hypothetical protein
VLIERPREHGSVLGCLDGSRQLNGLHISGKLAYLDSRLNQPVQGRARGPRLLYQVSAKVRVRQINLQVGKIASKSRRRGCHTSHAVGIRKQGSQRRGMLLRQGCHKLARTVSDLLEQRQQQGAL